MFATFLRLDSHNQPGWQGVNLALTTAGVVSLATIKIGASPSEYPIWSYLFGTIFLMVLGCVQFFWQPQTPAKNKYYLAAYHVVLIFSSLTISVFNPLFIGGWAVLMVASGILLHLRGVLISFSCFISIIVAGSIIHHLQTSIFLSLLVQSSLIGGTAIVVAQIIVMSQRRGADLEQSREKERLERERLLALVNSMGDAVIAVNEKGEISVYNAAASSLLDTNIDLVGKPITRVLHLRDTNGKKVNLMKMLAELKSNIVRTDLRHQFNDKEMIDLYLNIALIHLGYQKEGERGYTFLLRDITKEKSLEQERDEFISVVSHELRTPIAIAEGSLSNVLVLQDRGISKETITESIKEAHEQVLFLSKMTNDLATLSRAERGTADLEIEPIDVPSLLEELRANYEHQATEKHLQLITRIKGKIEALDTSKLYIQEILQNFITNALKYTKEGSVTVTAEMDRQHHIIFTVKDTGIGISKSDQKRLFEKFFRSEDYRTRESSGTGLGLYLVKKLAEQLNAKISIESRLNFGSTFRITIPQLERPSKNGEVAPKPATTNHES
ncbi:MAG TPA: ATP-binding protein [Candidatus Saccharimonadales bacterium]|nr:ATP-binding protein [Candidatus Saccharimonadales bacterium]